MKLILPWKVVAAGAAVLLLALIVLGLVAADATRGAEWPMICDNAGQCVYATVTPVVWGEATTAAVATWESGRPSPAP